MSDERIVGITPDMLITALVETTRDERLMLQECLRRVMQEPPEGALAVLRDEHGNEREVIMKDGEWVPHQSQPQILLPADTRDSGLVMP